MTASKNGMDSIMIGLNIPHTPTVFQLPWPHDIRANIVSSINPNGKATKSDLKQAVLVFCSYDQNCCGGQLQAKHIGM